MITELKIKNFQIHESTTIKFTKGLNVVIGDTDAGKSALIRALYLIIMNQPRSGESIYQNSNTTVPLEIQIKDDKGNVIKRHKRKYYLNGSLMKAVGTDIPIPIAEILPFKDVNWQKQLEQHFLILNTGGAAAKTLNASSGMEDQESLMKEIKSQMSEHSSNIKRLLKNNHEHELTINRLKSVTRLLINAKAIKNIKKEADTFENKIDQLNTLLINIFDCRIDPMIYERVDSAKIEINEIEKLIVKRNQSATYINLLENLCYPIIDARKLSNKISIYNMLHHSIISLFSELNEQEKIESKLQQLSSLTNKINEAQNNIVYFENKIQLVRKDFDQKLFELGECPLCGTEFKDGIKGGHQC